MLRGKSMKITVMKLFIFYITVEKYMYGYGHWKGDGNNYIERPHNIPLYTRQEDF